MFLHYFKDKSLGRATGSYCALPHLLKKKHFSEGHNDYVILKC